MDWILIWQVRFSSIICSTQPFSLFFKINLPISKNQDWSVQYWIFFYVNVVDFWKFVEINSAVQESIGSEGRIAKWGLFSAISVRVKPLDDRNLSSEDKFCDFVRISSLIHEWMTVKVKNFRQIHLAILNCFPKLISISKLSLKCQKLPSTLSP